MPSIKSLLRYAKYMIRVETLVSLFAKLLPVRKDMVIFSSYPDFSDNAWVLYKYLKINRPNLKLYWYANPDQKPNEVNEKEVLPKNAIYRQWILNRAYYIFNTHDYNLPIIKPKNRLYVLLSHGACPIKKNKSTSISKDYSPNEIVKHPHNFILCQGEGSVSLSSYFWRCDKRIMLPLGMMRNDLLIKNIGDKAKNPYYNGYSDKLILWMPTFRKSVVSVLSESNSSTESGLPLLESESEIKSFNEFLKANNVQLLIKIHPLQADSQVFQQYFSNITIITNESLDSIRKQTYEIIGYTDALLSDYSSVFFDYLIIDKPIGFIINDIEKYRSDRGFVFDDPREVMAGQHIYNIDQLKEFVIDVVSGEDNYLKKREEIRKKYIGEIPQSTCKRFVEYFNI